jgi:hypothetical protein
MRRRQEKIDSIPNRIARAKEDTMALVTSGAVDESRGALALALLDRAEWCVRWYERCLEPPQPDELGMALLRAGRFVHRAQDLLPPLPRKEVA